MHTFSVAVTMYVQVFLPTTYTRSSRIDVAITWLTVTGAIPDKMSSAILTTAFLGIIKYADEAITATTTRETHQTLCSCKKNKHQACSQYLILWHKSTVAICSLPTLHTVQLYILWTLYSYHLMTQSTAEQLIGTQLHSCLFTTCEKEDYHCAGAYSTAKPFAA